MTDLSFEAMRRAMVESQLRTTGVSDARVVAAMATVPRERFVPAERHALAYMDRPIALGGGRELNLPEATGKLLTAAQIGPDDHILVVGAGSGYTAALAAELARSVVALEENEALAEAAETAVAGRVQLVRGALVEGWAAAAPYDVVLIDGLVEHVPDALPAQLADGGRLACAILDRGASRLAIGRKTGAAFGLDLFADCEASPLPGFAKPKTFVF